MQPYGVRIIEYPDVADIHSMGSKSCVGKFRNRSGEYKGYCRKSKNRTRRYWKRKARREGKRLCEEE